MASQPNGGQGGETPVLTEAQKALLETEYQRRPSFNLMPSDVNRLMRICGVPNQTLVYHWWRARRADPSPRTTRAQRRLAQGAQAPIPVASNAQAPSAQAPDAQAPIPLAQDPIAPPPAPPAPRALARPSPPSEVPAQRAPPIQVQSEDQENQNQRVRPIRVIPSLPAIFRPYRTMRTPSPPPPRPPRPPRANRNEELELRLMLFNLRRRLRNAENRNQ